MAYEGMHPFKKMLPKTYQYRKHVAYEIYVALTHYKNLCPMIDTHVFNDGSAKELMSISGTINVVFDDNPYNIPVCLWLEETYPRSAPICYVTPSPEMMILKGRHISSNGEVLLPYLQEWRHVRETFILREGTVQMVMEVVECGHKTECDLVSLLGVMVAMFGEFPPVCVRSGPEFEQTLCSKEIQRTDYLSETDSNCKLVLTTEDGQPFQHRNETNC